MANITTTSVDTASLVIRDDEHEDGILDIAASGTFKEGLILARDSVSLKFVPFVKGGSTNENGIPKAVLPYELIAATSADQRVRVLTGGVVLKRKLVILADGDDANVDAAVRDQLRSYGIRSRLSTQLAHDAAGDDS